MKRDIATVEQLGELSSFDQIIDVRSPGEFAEDHIPGSINCPVLDNQQRIEIGTLYKQASPFEAKKLGAAYVSTNIARHLQAQFLDRPKNWRPLIVCWRGGQRSGAMTYVFRRVGWDAQQLEGGYKAYRRLVVEQLAEVPRQLQFKVLCGATGSAKSRILQAIGRRGEQVLDLEELACHKGSVLGVLPDSAQPSQKMFESQLLTTLRSLDASRPVYVEAESRKIGSLQVPAALIETMRAGECFNIEASFAARVDFLLRDYDYFLLAPERLTACLHPLRNQQSTETLQRWQGYVRDARWRELVSELLELHYDPLYSRSQTRNYGGFAAPARFTSDDLTPSGIEALALRVSGE
ncbi:MAG: tRNA 2-selenouridine synthase [Candidatus Accumulibacter regalis]|mgnify:CR=1 FL=1|jgi:tRNA 2-selenouridine synthase|uniref:tRNA 2-selenouridine synthase n=1 Tax=Accumulibacter regalis TaxID=522306 RepID=A0A011RC57_ACCRE|nr:tRNA 2-selenouridine(34) synthase MnmH [Accumulibacter sp.]EXI88809.1 MAG: tRNA 2-selenouridine synthase [Candidatus Accumulibacter regalis]MQM34068.1 tRNA 2-selenouridine(34) synthase MnmH [Candidatus Accumulibacter phosphatis]HRE69688.1 tRNA 2-selenouridine(34) synthase MnmH [Accumulibacter sp.]